MTGFTIGATYCSKRSQIHHFLEIVQYICNTTFLYQDLMRNPKKTIKVQISKYFSLSTFFYDHI